MLRNVLDTDAITISCVFLLVVLTVTKLTNPKRFNSFLGVLLDSRYFVIHNRELHLFDRFNTLLLVNTSVIISVILVLTKLIESNSFIKTVSFTAFILFLFFLIKFKLEKVTSRFFKIKKAIDDTILIKMAYLNSIGVIFLVLVVSIVYTTQNFRLLGILCLITVGLITFQRLVFSTKRNLSIFRSHPYQYILYLCALEITPYLVLYGVWLQKFK